MTAAAQRLFWVALQLSRNHGALHRLYQNTICRLVFALTIYISCSLPPDAFGSALPAVAVGNSCCVMGESHTFVCVASQVLSASGSLNSSSRGMRSGGFPKFSRRRAGGGNALSASGQDICWHHCMMARRPEFAELPATCASSGSVYRFAATCLPATGGPRRSCGDVSAPLRNAITS